MNALQSLKINLSGAVYGSLWLSIFLSSCLADMEREWKETFLPLMEYYCFDCHGDGMDKGGVNLDHYSSIAEMQKERDVWLNIEQHLKLNLMPPLDEEQMPTHDKRALQDWIDRALFSSDQKNPDPGPTLIRRLNRIEYENTINDLLGIKASLKEILPPDDTGYGFDNISNVLTLSPTHLDKLFQTAEIALDQAFSTDVALPYKPVTFTSQRGGVGRDPNAIYVFPKNGIMTGAHPFTEEGEYELRITAGGLQLTGQAPPLLEVTINGRYLTQSFITEAYFHTDYKTYSYRFNVPKTESQMIGVALINRPHKTTESAEAGHIQIFKSEVHGPLSETPSLPAPYVTLVGERSNFNSNRAYFQAQISPFLTKAFRRPILKTETEKYLTLAMTLNAEGESTTEALRSTYLAALLSPNFLFREGHQSAPLKASSAADKKGFLVDEFTLANRLSYFLWSSMPDSELMALAQEGALRANLDQQVSRMLKSHKSSALIKNYIGQWLQLRDVTLVTPSRKHFSDFDHKIQRYMKKETELLLNHLLKNNAPLIQLLTSEYTYLNEPLANHYGRDDVRGLDFKRVKVNDPSRYGLLGHGSFLMLTSHPDRTSPVLRGKYVLENLLDLAPPPPPQDANQITEAKILKHHTLRQQLEMHRQDPSCASCHNLLDPIGFGLEKFNALGQLRTTYPNGKPILTYGSLYRGEIFHDATSMRKALITHYEDQFYTSAIKNLLIYATGRGLEWYDRATVRDLLEKSKVHDGRMENMIIDLIHSPPFQSKR